MKTPNISTRNPEVVPHETVRVSRLITIHRLHLSIDQSNIHPNLYRVHIRRSTPSVEVYDRYLNTAYRFKDNHIYRFIEFDCYSSKQSLWISVRRVLRFSCIGSPPYVVSRSWHLPFYAEFAFRWQTKLLSWRCRLSFQSPLLTTTMHPLFQNTWQENWCEKKNNLAQANQIRQLVQKLPTTAPR